MIRQIAIALLFLSIAGCKKKNPSGEEVEGKPETSQTPQRSAAADPSANTQVGVQTDIATSSVKNLQSKREKLIADIVAIVGSKTGNLTSSQWAEIKARYWCPGFNQELLYGANSSLPSVKALLESNSPKESPLIMQLATGNFVDVIDEKEQQALMAFHLLAMTTAGAGGRSLPAAINDRLDQAAPTRGDMFLFDIFDDAFVDVKQRRELNSSEVADWQKVALSPNPVYRLLALRNFWHVTPEPSQWLDFYSLYLNEKDPAIVNELVDLATQSAQPDAKKLLSGLKSNSNAVANPELAARIGSSIKWIESLPPATSKNP